MKVSNLNPRQFKKLCNKSYYLLTQLYKNAKNELCVSTGDRAGHSDDWHCNGTLKGTKGIGRISGYFEPEWSDCSAWHALYETVFWHFSEHVSKADIGDFASIQFPEWPKKLRPKSWKDVLVLAEKMIDEIRNPKIKMVRVLTEDAELDAQNFTLNYEDRGCTCFINLPCSYCTHPGNPLNLEGDDSAWMEVAA